MTNRYDYSTAAALAREIGYDRSTVADWIREGKIKAFSRARTTHYKIFDYEFKPANLKRLKQQKPYPKHKKPYSETEVYILRHCQSLTARQIATILCRNVTSVRVKRSRLRRKGVI